MVSRIPWSSILLGSPVGLETPTGQRVMFFAFDLRVGRDPTTLVFTLLGVVIFSVVLCTGVAVLLVKRVSSACNAAAAASSAMLVAAMILHCVVPSQALSWVSGVPSYFALTWLLWYSLGRVMFIEVVTRLAGGTILRAVGK